MTWVTDVSAFTLLIIKITAPVKQGSRWIGKSRWSQGTRFTDPLDSCSMTPECSSDIPRGEWQPDSPHGRVSNMINRMNLSAKSNALKIRCHGPRSRRSPVWKLRPLARDPLHLQGTASVRYPRHHLETCQLDKFVRAVNRQAMIYSRVLSWRTTHRHPCLGYRRRRRVSTHPTYGAMTASLTDILLQSVPMHLMCSDWLRRSICLNSMFSCFAILQTCFYVHFVVCMTRTTTLLSFYGTSYFLSFKAVDDSFLLFSLVSFA